MEKIILIVDDYVAIATGHARIFPPPPVTAPEVVVVVEPLIEFTEDDIRNLLAAFELHYCSNIISS
jgi:hypothetical protein